MPKACFNSRDFDLTLYGRDISRPCAFGAMNCQARLNHALVILTVRQRSYNAKSIRNCFLMPSLTCRTMLVALILQLVATILQIDKKGVVPPAGFEPAIYTLKGCCPGPLDDGGLRHGHYSIEPQNRKRAACPR